VIFLCAHCGVFGVPKVGALEKTGREWYFFPALYVRICAPYFQMNAAGAILVAARDGTKLVSRIGRTDDNNAALAIRQHSLERIPLAH